MNCISSFVMFVNIYKYIAHTHHATILYYFVLLTFASTMLQMSRKYILEFIIQYIVIVKEFIHLR